MAAKISPKRKAEIRAAYVAGEGSLAELAAKFKIHLSTLKRWARDDDWIEAREKVVSKAQDKADEQASESLAAMFVKHRRAAARFTDVALRRLEQQLAKGKEISPYMLDTLSGVLARMVPVERLAAGVERQKPVVVLDEGDGAEVVVDIDAPDDADQAEPMPAPKLVGAAS